VRALLDLVQELFSQSSKGNSKVTCATLEMGRLERQ
jgi:hypothetical protein